MKVNDKDKKAIEMLGLVKEKIGCCYGFHRRVHANSLDVMELIDSVVRG